jgi:hypothetical protein
MGAGTHLVRCGVDLDLGDGFAPGWGEEEARGGRVVVVYRRGEDCADPEDREREKGIVYRSSPLSLSRASLACLPETNFYYCWEGRKE